MDVIDAAQIQVASGAYVWPLEPYLFVPNIHDIAWHLSHQCRFSGATSRMYSTCEHSVRVSDEVARTDPANALWGLLHDASEYLLGDLPAPLKHSPFGDEYRRVERALQERICNHFMLAHMEPSSVRDADARLAVTERRDLLPRDPAWRTRPGWVAYADVEPLTERIKPWPAWVARSKFLQRYAELTHQRTTRRAA